MSVNILVVDDETDVTDLFQQQFRLRHDMYVGWGWLFMHPL